MKKFLACVLIATQILSCGAFAEVNFSVIDAKNDKVTITGTAPAKSKVLLVVLDTGCTEESVKTNENAVLYTRSQIADENGYSFDFVLNHKTGGDAFTAIVTYDTTKDTTKDTKTFSFYPETVKASFIQEIETGNITADDVTKAVKMFGYTNHALVSETETGDIAALLTTLRDEENGFADDATKFDTVFRQALILNAIHKERAAAYDTSGKLKSEYATLLGLHTLTEYADYSLLNADGLAAMKSAMAKGNAMTKAQMKALFQDAVHLHVLTDYSVLGYGHIAGYLDKYDSVYKNAGFDLSGMANVNKKYVVYAAVAGAETDSLTALANIFNAAVVTADQSTGGGGTGGRPSGGSAGGGGVSTGSTEQIGYLPTEPITSTSETTITFRDIEKGFWAEEYIYALAEKGVLNGKGDAKFEPFDMVSRSEFVKMIVLALGMTPDESGCDFADMQNSWAKAYVGTAVADGFVSGMSETEFAPDAQISREQAATMVGRALKLTAPEKNNVFVDDNEISDYAKGYVYALKNLKIIEGKSGNAGFAPQDALSRAEAAKIIYGIMQ